MSLYNFIIEEETKGMSCFEWVIMILVLGFVSMIEICAITVCVSKTLDAKMKAKAMIEYKLFRAEMKSITELLDVYFDKFIQIVDNSNHAKDAHISTKKPSETVEVEDLDFDADPDNWLKN